MSRNESSETHKLLIQEKKVDAELKEWKYKTQSSSYEMELLHKYNDIKDATQILLGAIGNLEGVTVRELHKKYNLPLDN